MKVLLLDNHDSFTYNIAHIIRAVKDVNLQIITSDTADPELLGEFDGIIFSPGPDIPDEHDIMHRVLKRWEGEIPILGICLGLQAIVLYYGGSLRKLPRVVHGITKKIDISGGSSILFKDLPGKIEVGLYHSWIADRDKLPGCLVITALSEEGRIMGIRHNTYPIEAVQFHPESIMTPLGTQMLSSWIQSLREPAGTTN